MLGDLKVKSSFVCLAKCHVDENSSAKTKLRERNYAVATSSQLYRELLFDLRKGIRENSYDLLKIISV
jgi:hypothetical protein